jgi:hypothetical protein
MEKREKGSQVKNAMHSLNSKIPLSKISKKGRQFFSYRFSYQGGMDIKVISNADYH